jgi:hypothetical protein
MDERLRGRGLWIGLGGLAIVFLCVLVCGLGALAFLGVRSGPVYVPPAAGAGGGTVAPGYYYAPVGAGLLGSLGTGISLLFRFLLFGLLLLLVLRLFRHLFWGRRAWRMHAWPQPPEGREGQGQEYAAWGPWAWHRHYRGWHCPPGWGPPPREEQGESEGPAAAGPGEAAA